MKKLYLRLWPWRMIGASAVFWPSWYYLVDQRAVLAMAYVNFVIWALAKHQHQMASHITRPARPEDSPLVELLDENGKDDEA